MSSLIQFKDVGFSVDHEKQIIKNFTLDIAANDFVVILGSNGSGKSTLLKLLNRTYHHTSGTITLNDKPIESYAANVRQQHLVTISQFMADSLFLDLTIEENALLIESIYLKSIGKPFQKKKFLKALPDYLAQYNENLVTHLKTPINKLSGGEQQILAFALYLRRHPQVVLLDEHTSALDPKKSKHVMQFIQQFITQHKIACLMTTHQLEYALEYGNRLVAIRDGQLAFDTTGEAKENLTAQTLLTYCY